jgi:hypothetical protein
LEQRCILYEGLVGGSLVGVLNSWIVYVSAEDAPYWNRKGAYVGPLGTAARSLLEMGLAEIWEKQIFRCPDGAVEFGGGSLMLRDMAVDVVSDHENWSRYDPDGNWDPEEDLSRYADMAATNTEPMTKMYTVIATQEARNLGLVRFP